MLLTVAEDATQSDRVVNMTALCNVRIGRF